MSQEDTDLQRDEWLAATDEDAASVAVREHMKDVHTALPAIITGYDPKTQTVRARPAIKREWIEDGFKELPECVDVPVQFPRAGNFILTFPVAMGDECLLIFSERSIDNWQHAGGTQEPAEVRFHDLSDGFAILGFTSKPRALGGTGGPPPSTDATELRTLDGSTVIRLESSTVILGTTIGAQPAVKGDLLATVLAAIKSHTHPCTGGTTSPSLELKVPGAMPDPRSSKVKVG